MNETGLVQVYVLVFFVYGLAFFGMGLAMALESGRSPTLSETRVLVPLAAFGVIHGAHEWFEAYLLQAQFLGTPLPPWLAWGRLILLGISFSCLLVFAYNLLRLSAKPSPTSRGFHMAVPPLYFLVIAVGLWKALPGNTIAPPVLLDGLARYLLAVPAALMATLALRARGRQAREQGHARLGGFFRLAALGFGLYTLTQVFVPAMDMFPASVLNADRFLDLTGFPIQAVRTAAAVMITYGLMRAAQLAEIQRNADLAGAQQARLEALQQKESLRRELLRHIVQAQEDERARIARELHDETAQVLSAFTLEVGALRNHLGNKAGALPALDRLQDLSRMMSQGVYRLVHDLRPAQLDDLGLIPALKFLLEQDCCPKGMDVTFEAAGPQRRLDPLIETVLFRVAQEGLANVIRHAGTRQAGVCLRFETDRVALRIQDQGRGFDPGEEFHPPRGWGLAGMRERVEAVGGRLHLDTAIGRGTIVEVTIPLDSRGKETDRHEKHILDAGG